MRTASALLALLFAAGVLSANDSAAALAERIRDAGLDPDECYRVRELNFSKEDARFYLTEGYLILGRPVNGVRLSAVFSAEVEGGDGELLLMPPHRGERLSLSTFTHTPNLNEHFRTVLMLFTDDTAGTFLEHIRQTSARKSPEMGAVLAQNWDPVLRNLSGSQGGVRLVQDLLSPRRASLGLFYAAISGASLGNFDLVYDPRRPEQIMVGQVATREDRTYFDIWTTFPSRSARNGARPPALTAFDLANVRIEATLEDNLTLKAVTRAELILKDAAEHALPFELSRGMRVTEVRVNGEPAEVYRRESMRANLIRRDQNDTFLVMPASRLEAGRPHQIEFHHEGEVVSAAGNDVYFVGARGNWYPQHGLQFVECDITFRYSRQLDLVASGEVVEDSVDGEWRVTRRKSNAPVRLAGFNLGRYQKASVRRAGYTVEVYANRRLENALQPRQQEFVMLPQPGPGWPRQQRRPGDIIAIPVHPSAPDPAARLDLIASEIAGALEFMTASFGAAPIRTLTVSPIPGTFGQGFPGLLYLSTLAYLNPGDRPAGLRSEQQQLFYSEILQAHETAHQWWGNYVTTSSYEDDWLMEALANYSALLYLEKRKGPRALETVLEDYKNRLLTEDGAGRTVESSGPITWGYRLRSSQSPNAWRVITYEKGSWIIHMLRRRMGDQRFFAMLKELCNRYRFRSVSTEEFRGLAREFLPPKSADVKLEAFFDTWVYGTGVPTLKLSYTAKGKAPSVKVTGKLTHSGVGEEFSVLVPVEFQFRSGKPVVHLIRSGDEDDSFTVTLPALPVKAVVDPAGWVLAVRPR